MGGPCCWFTASPAPRRIWPSGWAAWPGGDGTRWRPTCGATGRATTRPVGSRTVSRSSWATCWRWPSPSAGSGSRWSATPWAGRWPSSWPSTTRSGCQPWCWWPPSTGRCRGSTPGWWSWGRPSSARRACPAWPRPWRPGGPRTPTAWPATSGPRRPVPAMAGAGNGACWTRRPTCGWRWPPRSSTSPTASTGWRRWTCRRRWWSATSTGPCWRTAGASPPPSRAPG